jgi:hypothetical protein
MDGPRPLYQSRLEPLHDLVEILGPAWDRETDADALAALAQVLEVTHRRLHERLKPDETAEGRAFAQARRKDPAANHNAQSIVIHSLHRPGAPGIDRLGVAAARTQSHAKTTTTSLAAKAATPALESQE